MISEYQIINKIGAYIELLGAIARNRFEASFSVDKMTDKFGQELY